MRRLLCGIIAGAVMAASASAELYDFNGTDVDVEYWSYGGGLVDLGTWQGSAESSAILVVDFGANSYAFGYLWDGSADGIDMLDSADTAGALEYTYTDYSFGRLVETITYGSDTMGAGGHPTDWITFWESSDGVTWDASAGGASDSVLADGDWDGWSHETQAGGGDWGYDAATEPNTPVPEPGTLLLTGLGAMLIGVRRLRTKRADQRA